MIKNHNVKEFWVGNYGEFDYMSAKAVREMKTIYKNIELILVIPYLTKTINEYKQVYYSNFDSILIADIPQNTPHRYKILKCNRYIVNNSNFMICYVDHFWGGAAKTFKYAQSQKNIKIFNLSEQNQFS